MKLRHFRGLWGAIRCTDGDLARSPHLTMNTLFPALKRLGYDGVELPLKLALHTPDFETLVKETKLDVGFIIFTDGPVAPGGGVTGFDNHWIGDPVEGFTKPSEAGESSKDEIVETHLKVFLEQVEAAYSKFDFEPAYINSHSLKDYFTRDMAVRFFEAALEFCPQVMHETHRKRYLHSPWVARDFLPSFPELRLVADLSHWVNVAETDTNDVDLTQVIHDLAPQFDHIHCRVGYDHGPQVSDPRAPEWLPYMEGHERWWDTIWKAQAERGQKHLTIMAEHGPPNYQPTLPFSKEPVASIWDINHWIHLRRNSRFEEMFGSEATPSNIVPSETQGFRTHDQAR